MLDRAAVAAILTFASALASGHDWDDDQGTITLTKLATYDAGGLGSAEIVEYDPRSRRLFVVNALTSTVDILDVRFPSRRTKIHTIDTSVLVLQCQQRRSHIRQPLGQQRTRAGSGHCR